MTRALRPSTPAPARSPMRRLCPMTRRKAVMSVFELKNSPTTHIHCSFSASYPNPANTIVTIGHAFTSALPVTVKIFDIHGNEMMTALNTFQGAGTYSLFIDTKRCGDGTYFCGFMTGSGEATIHSSCESNDAYVLLKNKAASSVSAGETVHRLYA